MGGGFVLWCPAIREGVVLIYRIPVFLSTTRPRLGGRALHPFVSFGPPDGLPRLMPPFLHLRLPAGRVMRDRSPQCLPQLFWGREIVFW